MTKYVTYPRVNGFRELLDPNIGVTHVVDLTICYDDWENPPSVLDILRGRNVSRVHFYYRVHSVDDTPDIRTENWLYEQWQMKEALLHNHYEMIKQNNSISTSNRSELSETNNEKRTNCEDELKGGDTLKQAFNEKQCQEKNNNVPNSMGLHQESVLNFRSYENFTSLKFDMNNGKPIELSYTKLIFIHIFYFLVLYGFCQIIVLLV